MLYCDRRVLSVGHQFPGRPGFAAQSLEYLQMIGTWAHEPRLGPFHQRRNESERLV